jgi:accessory gene regulator protein AgrB
VLSQQPRGQYQKERNIQTQITKDNKQDKQKPTQTTKMMMIIIIVIIIIVSLLKQCLSIWSEEQNITFITIFENKHAALQCNDRKEEGKK